MPHPSRVSHPWRCAHQQPAAGGLVPTGEASTAAETNFNQPPLRFHSTEESDSEASSKETNLRTSTQYASYYSSVFQESNLSAAPYYRRVVETKSRQNRTFDPGGLQGHLHACLFLGSWRTLVCGKVVRAGAAGKDCSSFLEDRLFETRKSSGEPYEQKFMPYV